MIIPSDATKSSCDQLIYVEPGVRQLLNAFKHVKAHDFVLHLATFFKKKFFFLRWNEMEWSVHSYSSG